MDRHLKCLNQWWPCQRTPRLCVQHNDKFLQRQDYWRDTAPAAIDRTSACNDALFKAVVALAGKTSLSLRFVNLNLLGYKQKISAFCWSVPPVRRGRWTSCWKVSSLQTPWKRSDLTPELLSWNWTKPGQKDTITHKSLSLVLYTHILFIIL